MWQNNFFLACIDWSRALDFRICLEKTLVAFDFDEKLKQSVAKITRYVTSRVKTLASPAFCGWSSAFKFRCDSENEKMLCKQKHWIKNMAVKFRFWFCSALVYLTGFISASIAAAGL